MTNVAFSAQKIDYSGRHVIILRSGIEKLFGTYLFIINNNSTTKERIRIALLLPVADIYDISGPWAQQIEKLDRENYYILATNIPPGVNRIGINFTLKPNIINPKIWFNIATSVNELAILTQNQWLKFYSNGKAFKANNIVLDQNNFHAFSTGPLVGPEKFTVSIVNLPLGRNYYLWTALGLALLVLIGVLFFLVKNFARKASQVFIFPNSADSDAILKLLQ